MSLVDALAPTHAALTAVCWLDGNGKIMTGRVVKPAPRPGGLAGVEVASEFGDTRRIWVPEHNLQPALSIVPSTPSTPPTPSTRPKQFPAPKGRLIQPMATPWVNPKINPSKP